MAVFQKWRIHITQGYGIPFLGIYAKDEASYSKDTCSTVFIDTLFIIARPQKQTQCYSSEYWTKENLQNEALNCQKK